MRFHLSIDGLLPSRIGIDPQTTITIITNDNYGEYQHALNTILHVVQAEISKYDIILQQHEESRLRECTEDTYEEPL